MYWTLTASRATELAGTDPDYGTQLLYDAIEGEKFPSWTVCIQTMTPAHATGLYSATAFDVTKTWSYGIFPLHEIGTLILDRNPENYFDEIEQLASAPSNLIPYIEPSPDPLLQACLFIYPDAQRYRLGVNNHLGSCPNYKSSTQCLDLVGPVSAIDSQIRDNTRHEVFNGTAYRDLTMVQMNDFIQPRELWNRVWNTEALKTAFVDNVSAHLNLVKNRTIVSNQLELLVFSQVDSESEMANRISAKVNVPV